MNPSLAPRRIAAFMLAATIFLADQGLKNWVLALFRVRGSNLVELLPFFDLRYTQNYGISLGLLTAESQEGFLLLVLLTGAITLGVSIWILREKGWPELIALGAVLGGALGNIRDRTKLGFVVDYADLHFGEFRPFMIFNLADVAISLGVVLLLARAFLMRDKPAQEAAPEAATES